MPPSNVTLYCASSLTKFATLASVSVYPSPFAMGTRGLSSVGGFSTVTPIFAFCPNALITLTILSFKYTLTIFLSSDEKFPVILGEPLIDISTFSSTYAPSPF